jgi:Tfp pilus assembly protein PilN
VRRPAASAVPAPAVTAGGLATSVPRTRFILLVLGLLSGGLVCLLVINTTLAAASFRISALQQGNAALTQQQQELQQKVTTERSAASLAQRAKALGMRTQPLPDFLNLRTGKVFRSAHTLPGVPSVPGYAP